MANRRGTLAPVPAPRAWTVESIEARRDRTFRRLPALRVGGRVRALQFLDEVGLATLFAYRAVNLPCLWVAVCGRRDPEFPHHSHHDAEVGLAWNLKDELPSAGKVFYAKLYRGKPTFVAWDIFPAVHRLFGPQRDHVADYRAGLLSPAAKAILDTLHRGGARETVALRLGADLARPSQRRAFDAAMAELQQRLYIAMSEVRYDPSFTYVWDLVESRAAAAVRAARRLSEAAAALALARRYLRVVVCASPNDLAMALGARARAERALAQLLAQGAVQVEQRIDGWPGRWIVWKE